MNRHFFARLTEYFLVVVAMIFWLMAASDGPYFPWLNFGGLICLCAIACFVAWRVEHKRQARSIPWRYRPYMKTINR